MTRSLPPSRLLVALLVSVSPLSAAPLITEFLASNTTGLADEDGTRQDWIEVHNPDAAVLDLGGYHLTDNDLLPMRWTFPAGVLVQPGGYLVVFASTKDRAVAGAVLHTNFALSDGGEYLALNAPGGAPVLSSFAPAAQSSNVSYGLISTTPGSQPAYFNTPTPGAANNTSSSPAEPVQFSLSSRTFDSAVPLSISLSVASPTASIRYTTNRTVPTAASTLYTGTPIPVSANTRIRARSFEPDRPDGPVVSETYFALDAAAQTFTSNLPIVITDTWGAGVTNDVVVSSHIMIFEPKLPDNLARMTNLPDISAPCSVERRGSSTAGDPKYSLTLETWDESNNDRNFPILGMPSDADWVMHAPYLYDRSLMHNDLIYRISNDAGRYATRTKYVEHFHNTTTTATVIGGALTGGVDYFGVYSFMEKITRGEDRVDVEKLTTLDTTLPVIQGGYMFKVDRRDPGDAGITALPGQSLGIPNEVGWVYPKERSPDPSLVVNTAQSNYFRDYIGDAWASLQLPVFMDPANGYANFFDVPSVIDHQILNIAAKNVDANRLSAYWSKPRFGKLTAGPIWDFDRAEGSFDSRDVNPITWRGDNGDLGTDFFHYPWFNEMFKDPNFWQAYIDRYDEMRMTAMSTAAVFARIDEFAAQLNPGDAPGTPAKRNFSRWTGAPPRGAQGNTPGTNGTYAGEIVWLKNWWNSRLNFMDGQFTRPATASVPSGPVAPGTQVTLTSPSLSTPGVKIYYTTNGTDPRPQATAPEAPSNSGVTIATLLPEIGTVRAIVSTTPTLPATAPTVGWRGADLNSNGDNLDDFDDSTWFTNAAGTINGVGYDDNTAGVNYLPFQSIRWNSTSLAVPPANYTNTMRTTGAVNGNQSCYIRWPFTLSAADMANLVAPNKLVLQARYDDGFVLWVNGTMTTARPNAQPPGAPPNEYTHASAATGTHDDAASITYIDFDITAFMGGLHVGNNVLAVQGLNSGLTSSDFIIQARLVVQAPPPPYTPAISPDAVEYTGPITINAPTQLFVRTLNPIRPSDPPTQGGGGTGEVPNGSSWSAPTRLYYFPGAVSASQASIQITEVLYHPEPPATDEVANGWTNSNDFEFIRLTNTGAVPVDLTGIYFSNGLEFTAAPGLQNWLPAGQSVVVVENTAAFTYRYGTTFTIVGEFKGELDDGGEHIVLNDKTGTVISDFRYEDDGLWPVSADNGFSLLYASGDQTLPGSWRTSLDPGGTLANTYSRWLRRYFPNSEIPFQPMSQDDDGDGLNNLGEYAFATDPRVPGSGEHAMATSVPGIPARMTVRRRSGATDLTWTFETATNLTGWTSAGSVLESVVSNGDGTETATWRSPAPPVPPRRLFMRAKVTSP